MSPTQGLNATWTRPNDQPRPREISSALLLTVYQITEKRGGRLQFTPKKLKRIIFFRCRAN